MITGSEVLGIITISMMVYMHNSLKLTKASAGITSFQKKSEAIGSQILNC